MSSSDASHELVLVQRILTADRAAFDEVFDRLVGPMLAYAARTLPPAMAREVAAESLGELFATLGESSAERSLAGTLLVIGRRRVAAVRYGLGAAGSEGDAVSRMR